MHATRLKYYADASLNVTEQLREHVINQGVDFEIAEFKDLRFNNTMNRFEILVGWSGFEAAEDSWEPFLELWKNTYFLLLDFLLSLDGAKFNLLKRLCQKNKKIILEKGRKHKTLAVEKLPF